MDTKTLLHDDDITFQDEELIFNPYNQNNKEISKRDVQNILEKYGIPCSNIFNLNLYNV